MRDSPLTTRHRGRRERAAEVTQLARSARLAVAMLMSGYKTTPDDVFI